MCTYRQNDSIGIIVLCDYAETVKNSLWPSDAIRRQRSGSTLARVMTCLLPDGIKPLPESMLFYHQYGLVAFIWGQFRNRYLSHHSLKLAWKLPTQNRIEISQRPMSEREYWRLFCLHVFSVFSIPCNMAVETPFNSNLLAGGKCMI